MLGGPWEGDLLEFFTRRRELLCEGKIRNVPFRVGPQGNNGDPESRPERAAGWAGVKSGKNVPEEKSTERGS